MKSDTHVRPPVALVTGAGGTVGPGICEALTDAGWIVAATDSIEKGFEVFEKAEMRKFPAAQIFIADLRTRKACEDLVADVTAQLGTVALLVNNATFNPRVEDIFNLEEEYLQTMVAVNLWAPHFLLQACLPGFRKSATGASVVQVSSVQVSRTWPDQLVYPAMKAALETMAEIASRELIAGGIRINTIRLGNVPGLAFLREKLLALPVEKAVSLYRYILPKQLDALANLNPSGTAIRPNDVGAAVAFLASNSAKQINGATLQIDGGLQHLLRPNLDGAKWDVAAAMEEWEQQEMGT